MTTDSVVILFKKTDLYNFSLFRGHGVSVMGGHNFFVAKIGGCNFIDANFL